MDRLTEGAIIINGRENQFRETNNDCSTGLSCKYLYGLSCLSRSGHNFNTFRMNQMFSLEENTSFGLHAPGILKGSFILRETGKVSTPFENSVR